MRISAREFPSIMQGFAGYRYPESFIAVIGSIEIACTVVDAIPRTSILGAIMLTGYRGGATATNVRVDNPALIMTGLLGVLAWLGLFLRDDRVRALIPLQS